jgi:hypothetical protein
MEHFLRYYWLQAVDFYNISGHPWELGKFHAFLTLALDGGERSALSPRQRNFPIKAGFLSNQFQAEFTVFHTKWANAFMLLQSYTTTVEFIAYIPII